MIYTRSARPGAARLPDGIYLELVDNLFTTLRSIVLVGVMVLVVGGVLGLRTGDGAIIGLTAAMALWSLTRIALVRDYRRAHALRTMTGAEARIWEIRYALGSFLFAAMVAALDVRALGLPDTTAPTLVTGLIFAYGAGLTLRLSVRPWICVASLMIATGPTVIAMAARQPSGTMLPADRFAYLIQASIIGSFAIAGLETAGHLYRTLLAQLVAKSQLAGLARTDALTGLANRILLRERFEEELAHAELHGGMLALHFIDLDRFKVVNDQLGHPTGDAVLQEVARRLTHVLGPRDVAARLGGDEFMVLQAGITPPGADRLARRIVHLLAAPYLIGDRTVRIGASIGIALAPRESRDLDQLLAAADRALYQAKGEARGSVAFAHDNRTQATAA